LVLADIKNLPSQLTYVDNNKFLSYVVFQVMETSFFHSPSLLINGNTTKFIPKFNHICIYIAMITLGVEHYRNFSYRCIFFTYE
jgi:hypothetical protein